DLSLVLDPAVALLDAVDEPGEELATEEALGLDDVEEILGHGCASTIGRRGTPASTGAAGTAARLDGSAARTAATAPGGNPTGSAAGYGINGTGVTSNVLGKSSVNVSRASRSRPLK